MKNKLLKIMASLFALMAMLCGDTRGEPHTTSISEREHLLPFTNSFDADLRPIFDKKLLLTPANYGRMIRMHNGPDVGDSVVSVYCNEGSDTRGECFVSLTKSDANLDVVMATHRADRDPFKKVKEIRVVKKEARISHQIATLFRHSLRALLPVKGDHRVETVEGWGFNRIEFWLAENGVRPSNGESPRKPGKRITTLIEIGDLLGRYCEAPEAKRSEITEQIERKAELILRSQGESNVPKSRNQLNTGSELNAGLKRLASAPIAFKAALP